MRYLKIAMVTMSVMLSVSVFAQDSTSQKTTTKEQADKAKYTCSMHPAVISDKPGKCPKCGMSLVKVSTDATAKTYTCPMHPDVTSSKPGKCPTCKMKLVPKKEG